MQGDLDESERMMKHAISLFQEVDDEWATSFCYEILGQIQMKRGLFDEALAFSQKAQDILLPRIGNMHRDIADNLEWRGNIFRAMGELEKAADCYTEVAAIYHKLNFTKKEENALAALRTVQS